MVLALVIGYFMVMLYTIPLMLVKLTIRVFEKDQSDTSLLGGRISKTTRVPKSQGTGRRLFTLNIVFVCRAISWFKFDRNVNLKSYASLFDK